MAEEEDEGAWSDEPAEERTDPENGSTGEVGLLHGTAKTAFANDLVGVVDLIMANVRGKHASTESLLFDLAARLETGEVEEQEYLSLAQVLWKSVQEADEKPDGERDN